MNKERTLNWKKYITDLKIGRHTDKLCKHPVDLINFYGINVLHNKEDINIKKQNLIKGFDG